MIEPRISGETMAATARDGAGARELVQRLRDAGFHDVRVSERTGATAEEHVPAESGMTENDFAASLRAAGYSAADAVALAREVAAGRVLVTVAAAERLGDAIAVARGERVTPAFVPPVAPSQLSPVAPVETASEATVAPENRVVQLRSEQLDISKEATFSQARIHREKITEMKTIVVPVSHEELVIERDGAPTVRVPLDLDAPTSD